MTSRQIFARRYAFVVVVALSLVYWLAVLSSPKVVPPPPPLQEIVDLRALSEQGDRTAQLALASRYAAGRDVPKDDVEATRWYREAAAQGDRSAQLVLANRYALSLIHI